MIGMKKVIVRSLLIIFSAGIVLTLVLNFFLQIFLNNQKFQNTSAEHFEQIERIMEEKEGELAKVKEDFAEDCIIRARAAAYIAQHYPAVVEDREECKLIASLLQVDELHFFDKQGVIYAGTHPEYYGYSFSSGEQMSYFAPMLEDFSLELCQDITPNTAEQKLMQYAAVWSQDGKQIVQVGLEPNRVFKAIEGNNISDIFSLISTDTFCAFYAVDVESKEILGSTDRSLVGKKAADIGLDTDTITEELSWGRLTIGGERQYYAAKRAGSLILIKTCISCEMYREIAANMFLLCIYFLLLFMILIFFICRFLDRKIIGSIVNINKNLKKIEQGDWSVVLSENSTKEFEELSHYINMMVNSLLDFPKKISKALDLSQVPIGICEYTPDTGRFIATSRVKDILLLTEEEFHDYTKHPESFEQKRAELCSNGVYSENNIYRLDKGGEHYIRMETFIYKKSEMTILIDVTADIQEKQRIAKERDTDALTGLYNRGAFYRRMELLFESPEQLKNAIMVMIDLDQLKKVNDSYGHADGDRYLLALSEFLHACARGDKIAARMGGDEFLLFAYGNEEGAEERKLIEELLAFCGSHKVVMENGEEIMLEFSMGWALYPKEETDYQELIKLADKRMYEDKKQRKEGKELYQRDFGKRAAFPPDATGSLLSDGE